MEQGKEYIEVFKEKAKENLAKQKERKALEPSLLNRAVSKAEEGIFSNENLISHLLFWPAILVLLFVVIYRIRKRNTPQKKKHASR